MDPGHVFDNISQLPAALLASLDAIFVPGGGVPSSPEDPPSYVQLRCDVAAQVYTAASSNVLAILCLSAGTAHMPQLLSREGLPVWESTASAGYLMQKHGIPPNHLFVETTSYDTISNAFFARTSYSDISGWRKILIINNDFHMDRTKAIFDWIYNADPPESERYELYYLRCDNVGLSREALAIREEHERKSTRNVLEKLAPRYSTLKGVWKFLTSEHTFYSAQKLVKMAEKEKGSNSMESDVRPISLKESYGAARRTVAKDVSHDSK